MLSTLIVTPLPFMPASAQAQTIEQQMARCLAIADQSARLVCFEDIARAAALGEQPDEAAPPEAATTGSANDAPVASAPAPAKARPAPAVDDSFGFSPEDLRARKEEEARREREARLAKGEAIDTETENPDKREETIRVISRNYQGRLVLTMENGQVWTQTDGGRIPDPHPGAVAEIRKGYPGGFLLRVHNRTIRVKRLK